MNIDDADDGDIDENELERELANLTPDDEEPKPAVVKQQQSKPTTANDSKLKKLELNLNSFNKKYNDAVSSNDATKSKRLKRIVDVSRSYITFIRVQIIMLLPWKL